MKKGILILLIVSFANLLFAEEKTVAKESGFSNWSIQTSLGKGSASMELDTGGSSNDLSSLYLLMLMSTPTTTTTTTTTTTSSLTTLMLLSSSSSKIKYTGESYHNHFKAEYKPNYFGFQFGLSTGTYRFKEKTDPVQAIVPFLLLSSMSPTASSTLLPFMLAPSNETYGLSLTTFDFAATFHARPFATIDPYIALGIGIGACDADCTLGKGFGKIGIRTNIGGGFIFLEGQSQVSVKKYPKVAEVPVNESMGMLGFGLYL